MESIQRENIKLIGESLFAECPECEEFQVIENKNQNSFMCDECGVSVNINGEKIQNGK